MDTYDAEFCHRRDREMDAEMIQRAHDNGTWNADLGRSLEAVLHDFDFDLLDTL